MVEGIPIINGYTTLLPLNVTKSFPENDNRINFLGTIEPGSAKANQWSVGYYLIDKSFAVNEDLSGYEIIYEDEDYQIRQIKTALPRFRYEDGSLAAVTNLKETPNQIEFQLESPINQILTVADRYDPNWEVTVDGGAESLMNCAEQRCLVALEGKHSYRLYYRPLMFYLGLGLTIATASIMAGWSWYNRKKRNNE